MADSSTINAEIEVDAPISAVYNQWTQFETFPEFLNAVKSVEQIDDTTTHWVTSIGGVTREFDARITDQVPDQHVAWASTDGKTHVGSVRFRPGGEGTVVSLEMTWLPESFLEKVGAALNIDERQAKADLERFKDFMEKRQSATGAWRGEVHGGQETSGSAQHTVGNATDDPAI